MFYKQWGADAPACLHVLGVSQRDNDLHNFDETPDFLGESLTGGCVTACSLLNSAIVIIELSCISSRFQ